MTHIEMICILALILMALSVSFTVSSLLVLVLTRNCAPDIFNQTKTIATASISIGLMSFFAFVSLSSDPDAYIVYLVAYLVVMLPLLTLYASLLSDQQETVIRYDRQ